MHGAFLQCIYLAARALHSAIASPINYVYVHGGAILYTYNNTAQSSRLSVPGVSTRLLAPGQHAAAAAGFRFIFINYIREYAYVYSVHASLYTFIYYKGARFI